MSVVFGLELRESEGNCWVVEIYELGFGFVEFGTSENVDELIHALFILCFREAENGFREAENGGDLHDEKKKSNE